MRIDINCDMGEGIGNEALLMPWISSANIACGFHAGDEDEMQQVVRLCVQHNVAIGAHPSFPDRENFGRTVMNFSIPKIQDIITEQLEVLYKIAIANSTILHHVKLHGALYNMAAKDAVLAAATARAIKAFDNKLIYYALSGSVMADEAKQCGLKVAAEVFADRTYQADGSLTPRSVPGAIIGTSEEALQQVMQMVKDKTVTTMDGQTIAIQPDSVCVHGDGSDAVDFSKKVYNGLKAAGVQINRIN